MKIDVLISQEEVDIYLKNSSLDDKTVIVIDTLRATSVMVTAIGNGCKQIVAFREIEDTLKYKSENPHLNVLLGGERKGLKIDGFDLSNSPREYTKDVVFERCIAMSTSNGTKCLEKVKSAKDVLICSMLNVSAVSKAALDLKKDILIVNSGTNGRLSLDDFLTSAFVIDYITKRLEDVILTDAAVLNKFSLDRSESYLELVKKAYHYNYLKSVGYEKDLEYCLKKDLFTIVPRYYNGIIK